MAKNKVKTSEIRAVVCPKQKVVKIMQGSQVLKIYSFKMDIPRKPVEHLVFVHDYSEWCVANRDYHYIQKDVQWDKEIIAKIERDSLEYYRRPMKHFDNIEALHPNEQKFLHCLEAVSDESVWGLAIQNVMKEPTAPKIRALIVDLKSQASDNEKVMLDILGKPCYEQLLTL